jgi:hypothetical protein
MFISSINKEDNTTNDNTANETFTLDKSLENDDNGKKEKKCANYVTFIIYFKLQSYS